MRQFDVTFTDSRYEHPNRIAPYIENILTEDDLLRRALEECGLRVARVRWDRTDFDWSQTRAALFRTTWDYFDRLPEFLLWLERAGNKPSC